MDLCFPSMLKHVYENKTLIPVTVKCSASFVLDKFKMMLSLVHANSLSLLPKRPNSSSDYHSETTETNMNQTRVLKNPLHP